MSSRHSSSEDNNKPSMGIQGLLPVLKSITKFGGIHEFRGKTVAVDTYCWLHRAVYGSCIEMFKTVLYDSITNSFDGDLVFSNLKWSQYLLTYIDVLLAHDITVYLVFDGDDLPAKRKTEIDRESSRSENLRKGQQHLKEGNEQLARQFLSRAIDITPKMAAKLIQICKEMRPTVKFVVAPYEADAQLAYLSNTGLVDAIISEDSDVIPYACKTMIFKLEHNGSCQIIRREDIENQIIPGFDLRIFTQEMIVSMCVAAGCDYLSSLNGFGIKKSHKMMARYKSTNRMLRALRFEGLIPTIRPDNADHVLGAKKLFHYEVEFYKAILTFQHQVVFCLRSRKLVHLTPLSESNFPADLLPYINTKSSSVATNIHDFVSGFVGDVDVGEDIACGIADGLLDPVTKRTFDFAVDSLRANTARGYNLQNEPSIAIDLAPKKKCNAQASSITNFFHRENHDPNNTVSKFSNSIGNSTYKSSSSDTSTELASIGKSMSLPNQRSHITESHPTVPICRSVSQPSSAATAKPPITMRKSFPVSKSSCMPTYDASGRYVGARRKESMSPYFSATKEGTATVRPTVATVDTKVLLSKLNEHKTKEACRRLTSSEENNDSEDVESVSRGGDSNYDDFGQGYEESFSPPVVKRSFGATFESFEHVMYNSTDSVVVDDGPTKKKASPITNYPSKPNVFEIFKCSAVKTDQD